MGTAGTRAKRKWNKEYYTNVTAAMNPELASKLKKKCKESGVSVTSVITTLVAGYLAVVVLPTKEKAQEKTSDIQELCSMELCKHITAIEDICGEYEQYLDDIHENLHDSIRYGNAKNSVKRLRLAIDELKEAYQEGGR
ncbi:MAG: hypothetical protein FWG61_03125 [Firmicutes bacterium]|nr:hypothetical protein [Bacillota bacterium]